MKVVALLGSPRRKGNSSGLAEMLTSILEESGAEISTHFLNSLNYRGCQACNGCKERTDFCVLHDDLLPVLKDVQQSDVTIWASPVYWGDVTAQLKGFIDRTYSYLTPEFIEGPVRHRLGSGKKLVFILSQGGDTALYDDIFPRYNNFYAELGMFEESFLIRGCDLSERDDYADRDDLQDTVTEIAEKIMTIE